MIVTNDDGFARRVKHLSTTAKIDGIRFTHDEVGYNYRLVKVPRRGCGKHGSSKLPRWNARVTMPSAPPSRYIDVDGDCVAGTS